MDDRYDPNLILGYVEDELTAADRAKVDAMLAHDPALATLIDDLKRDRQTLRSAPAAAPPYDLTDAAIATLERHMLFDAPPAGSIPANAAGAFGGSGPVGTGVGTAPTHRFRLAPLMTYGGIAAVLALTTAVIFQSVQSDSADTGDALALAEKPSVSFAEATLEAQRQAALGQPQPQLQLQPQPGQLDDAPAEALALAKTTPADRATPAAPKAAAAPLAVAAKRASTQRQAPSHSRPSHSRRAESTPLAAADAIAGADVHTLLESPTSDRAEDARDSLAIAEGESASLATAGRQSQPPAPGETSSQTFTDTTATTTAATAQAPPALTRQRAARRDALAAADDPATDDFAAIDSGHGSGYGGYSGAATPAGLRLTAGGGGGDGGGHYANGDQTPSPEKLLANTPTTPRYTVTVTTRSASLTRQQLDTWAVQNSAVVAPDSFGSLDAAASSLKAKDEAGAAAEGWLTQNDQRRQQVVLLVDQRQIGSLVDTLSNNPTQQSTSVLDHHKNNPQIHITKPAAVRLDFTPTHTEKHDPAEAKKTDSSANTSPPPRSRLALAEPGPAPSTPASEMLQKESPPLVGLEADESADAEQAEPTPTRSNTSEPPHPSPRSGFLFTTQPQPLGAQPPPPWLHWQAPRQTIAVEVVIEEVSDASPAGPWPPSEAE